MTTLNDKTAEFLRKLYRSTESASINWQRAFEDDSVEAKIGNLIVKIRRIFSEIDGSSEIVLYIQNEYGTIVDVLTDESLPEPPTSVIGFSSFSQVLERVFAIAFRQASGAENALDSLIDDLSE